jgi:hypothetical protein
MVKYIILTFLVIITSAVTGHAMDRYYCAADDSQLKLSVDAGFEEQPGWPLGHLRGIVIFKPGQGKTLQGTLMLGSRDVVQYWRDGKSMMLRTSSKSGSGLTATDVDVVLDSKMVSGNINRFKGGYKVIVRPLGKSDPSLALTREGGVSCSRF